MTLQNSTTSLLRPFLVAFLAAACVAAPPTPPTNTPADDPATTQHLRESVTELTAQLEKTPDNIPTRLELARAYSQLSDFASAEKQLERATADAPNNATAWAAYGLFECERQQWTKRSSSCKRVLPWATQTEKHSCVSATPINVQVIASTPSKTIRKQMSGLVTPRCVARGRLYFIMGSPILALEDFTKAIELKENSSQAYLGRADVERSFKDISKSFADYSSAIEADPKSPANYEALSTTAEGRHRRLSRRNRRLHERDRSRSQSTRWLWRARRRIPATSRLRSGNCRHQASDPP